MCELEHRVSVSALYLVMKCLTGKHIFIILKDFDLISEKVFLLQGLNLFPIYLFLINNSSKRWHEIQKNNSFKKKGSNLIINSCILEIPICLSVGSVSADRCRGVVTSPPTWLPRASEYYVAGKYWQKRVLITNYYINPELIDIWTKFLIWKTCSAYLLTVQESCHICD